MDGLGGSCVIDPELLSPIRQDDDTSHGDGISFKAFHRLDAMNLLCITASDVLRWNAKSSGRRAAAKER
jgi:hypothetical protein